MQIQERLQEIWSKSYISDLPYEIKERGFIFSANYHQKDILITGINPSFRESDDVNLHSFDFQNTLHEDWDNYWGPLKKMIRNESDIDLSSICSYLDIFYFREKEQTFLREKVLKSSAGIPFIVDQINLTQHIIEDVIKPKVIIVKNKESAAYWGKLENDGIIWMGYKFEYMKTLVCGELFKITGLIESSERIAPEIKISNIENTLVLFTQHINQYTAKEKRPTPEILKTLLDFYNVANELDKLK
jgi:hypothetical protein